MSHRDEFWQLVVTVETAPAFLCALDQFEDHRERGPVRQTALRSDGAVAHGGEGAFDGGGRPQVFPVLGREVVESEQRVSILAQAVGRLLVFQRVALDEGVERQLGGDLRFGHPYLLQRAFGFGCWLFGNLASTFAVLCTRQRCSRVFGQTSPAAFQNPRAPSAMTTRGGQARPR